MTKKIALFNHKGGVSKTTTTFNLGWMLASKGKRVILVDADPQCNLTGMVLGYTGITQFEQFYEKETKRNLRDGLTSAFESSTKLLEAIECLPIEGQEGLFLLPGHIGVSEYEVMLGIAQGLSNSIDSLQNLPGAIFYLLEKTGKKFEADYMLIDMSSSISPINQNLLMTSNFFVVPATLDYLSVMAIESLKTILPIWHFWAQKAGSLWALKNAVYSFPKVTPIFLGTIMQKSEPRGGVVAVEPQEWVDEINKTVSSKLTPELRKIGMMLPDKAYENQDIGSEFCLATIPDFKTLIAKSQEAQTPVFSLTREQIGSTGPALAKTIESCNRFKQVFSKLADKIIGLTNCASSD